MTRWVGQASFYKGILYEGQKLDARRYLIRIFETGIEHWYAREPDFENLAKNTFTLSDTEHSVYEVRDGVEESLAVAAHALTNPKHRPDARSVVRIEKTDLPSLGIDVDEEALGETGLPRWDFRHRNLLAGRDQIVNLVKLIAELCRRGFDRLRRVCITVVNESLKAICGDSPSRCPEHVKLIANWCQSKEKSTPPSLSLSKIGEEMAGLEFDDDVIERLARSISSGDCRGDWYQSVKALRGRYAKHYLPEIKRRFRLSESDEEGRPKRAQ
jgi:hypothetical protein